MYAGALCRRGYIGTAPLPIPAVDMATLDIAYALAGAIATPLFQGRPVVWTGSTLLEVCPGSQRSGL